MGDHGNSLWNSSSFVSISSVKSSARRLTASLSPVKQGALFNSPQPESPPRISIASSSTSSAASPQTSKNAQETGENTDENTGSLPFYLDTKDSTHHITKHQQPAPISSQVQSPLKGLWKVDGVWPKATAPSANRSLSFPAMIVTPFANSLRSENSKPAQGNSALGQGANISPLPSSGLSAGYAPTPAGNTQTPSTVYQQIQEISSKRISTLDYLRKA